MQNKHNLILKDLHITKYDNYNNSIIKLYNKEDDVALVADDNANHINNTIILNRRTHND